MGPRRKAAIFRQLATATRAGVPLSVFLPELVKHFPGSDIRRLEESVRAGNGIADSFAAAGFSPFEVHLIDVGEQSGRTEVLYDQIALFLEQDDQIRKSIVRQCMYPAVVLHVAVFLAPIASILDSPIGYLMRVGTYLGILYLAVFLIFQAVRVFIRTPAGQAIGLRVPLLGKAWRTTVTYRWILATHTAFSAGVPLPEAVAAAWQGTNLSTAPLLAAEGKDHLSRGESLASLWIRWPALPRIWASFISTGELSGTLDLTLDGLREEARKEWVAAQENVAIWIPKIVYGLIMLVVGYQIVTSFQKAMAPMDQLLEGLG